MKYKLLIFITLMMTIAACKKQPQPQVIEGFAFGTYYRITYVSEKPIDHLQQDVNAILQDVNRVYSLFDTNSVVSRFNRNEMVTMPFETPCGGGSLVPGVHPAQSGLSPRRLRPDGTCGGPGCGLFLRTAPHRRSAGGLFPPELRRHAHRKGHRDSRGG